MSRVVVEEHITRREEKRKDVGVKEGLREKLQHCTILLGVRIASISTVRYVAFYRAW